MANSDQPNPYTKIREKRTSRVYVHAECGGETVISGWDFTRLSNPLCPTVETYCCGCEQFVGLNEVAWADTGEVIKAYHKRLRRQMSYAYRWLPALLAAVGALIGWLVAMWRGNDANPAHDIIIGIGLGLILGSLVHLCQLGAFRDCD